MPVISTNTAANSALLNLNKNASMQEKYLNQLSSGSRINSSADDAAGLAVSGQLQADITTLTQSARNAQQADALLQTADGALARQSDILQRMKSLATQYNSGTVDATSRTFINAEYGELVNQLDLISSSSEFNGSALIDGSYNQSFVVGIDASDSIDVDLTTISTSSAGLNLNDALSVSGNGVFQAELLVGTDSATDATLLTALTGGISTAAAGDVFTLGLDIDADGTYVDPGEGSLVYTVAAGSTVGDLVAQVNAITDDTGSQIFNAEFVNGQFTISLIDASVVDTNSDGSANGTVDLSVTAADTITFTGTNAIGTASTVTGGATLELVAVGNALSAFNDDLDIIDTAITAVANARSQVGAFTAAFQFQNANINTQIENLSAAKSTIVDVDIAEAQTNFTNAQVLTEAATAALAQANQITTSLLSLLR
tara:strand:+ start:101609 stop:102895 length:1287 start_codon:yes stop_codon:yes gene_type:complete